VSIDPISNYGAAVLLIYGAGLDAATRDQQQQHCEKADEFLVSRL